ncbi:MAG TPA: fused MFS/spermidine synthase [Thermoanaerobaculia bacterium]|jgi:SAM-dependent methyltransferase|nr:fused MFS/spermidine synthase [Thermoanaerobaculia bacterium]
MKKALLATAFLEGLSVLIVEIAGARALAPYFGSSLHVWTAQITATLLFLALGYGLGGWLTRRPAAWKLPAVFWGAGIWLGLYPFLRNGVLGATAAHFGVAGGSFLASALLFGIPLGCLGAVSPLIISRLDALQSGAGSAAGQLFLVNTLGGLAGGWLTALVLIPHLPLRLALAGTGVLLACLGGLWGLALRRKAAAPIAPFAALLLLGLAPRPPDTLLFAGTPARVVQRQQSGVGLIQVLEAEGPNQPVYRALLIDGVTQGGMDLATGLSAYEFSSYLDDLSWRYHPQARSALLLGLGSGVLGKELAARGVAVTAAEIEPRIEAASRRWFGLPASVRVVREDARSYLNRDGETYDLIFLDVFAGENVPWYLVTREALQAVQRHLNPGGRLLVNWVTRQDGESDGLRRLEAGMAGAFGEAKIYVDPSEGGPLVNAILVAGRGLQSQSAPFPGRVLESIVPKLAALEAHGRQARLNPPHTPIGSDDFSDLDDAEADLRLEWRKLVLATMGPEVLAD